MCKKEEMEVLDPGRAGDEAPIKAVDFADLPPEFRKGDKPFGIDIHIFNIFFDGIFTHGCLAYFFLYLWPMGLVPTMSIPAGLLYGYFMGLGTTVGCHRYWTHKTFKANLPLQVLLMLLQTSTFQNTIFKWCRDHRVHHKYMDTNADPHNAARGFWFSHITWSFLPRHPDVVKGLRTIDISDLASDPVVRFQSKYYWELLLVLFFGVPLSIFYYLFPEFTFVNLFVANMCRYGVSIHFTYLVNSAAHLWGDKPYDKYISPTDNKWVSFLAVGEGWHNYHHTFPWDYKAAELGFHYNASTAFIHFFAKIGWAWDLKTVSHKLLVDRINRTGNENHPLYKKDDGDNDVNNNNLEALKNIHLNHSDNNGCWGWGDKELRKEDVEITETAFPAKSPRG